MLNGKRRQQAPPLHIPSYVTVTTLDLDRFRRANAHVHVDLQTIAECIRSRREELKDIPHMETIIIDRKDEHFKSVERVIRSSSTVVETALGALGFDHMHYAHGWCKAVSSNKEWFALKICDFVEADFHIAEEAEVKSEVRNIAVPAVEHRAPKVADIITKFGYSESIASDVESILETGFKTETFFSLLVDLVLNMSKGKEIPVDPTSFDFS
jgi:hypothetical protein